MPRLIWFLLFACVAVPPFLTTVWVLEKLGLPGRRALCVRFHRMLCAVLQVRIRVVGAPVRDRPALILSNHVSWLDIPVINAVAPIAFVAKREVASWPLVGFLAKLTRTVFVDRLRRQQTGEAAAEIAQRLTEGDPVVLFAEGTSSDGNRVLEFRSSLVGAVTQLDPCHQVVLQPLSIGYTRLEGLPMGRQHRPVVAWYGDIDFAPHFREFLRRGAVDVVLRFGEPIPVDNGADRKAAARRLEETVRRLTAATLRERAIESVT